MFRWSVNITDLDFIRRQFMRIKYIGLVGIGGTVGPKVSACLAPRWAGQPMEWNCSKSKRSVKICYSLTAMYALIGLVMNQIRTRYALLVYIIVFLISAAIVWKKDFLKMKGLRGVISPGTL